MQPVIAFASVYWNVQDNGFMSRASLGHQLETHGLMPAFANVPSHEFLVEFRATSTVPIRLEFLRWSALSLGAPMPQVALDIGNDGVLDVTNLGIGTRVTSFELLGPTPFAIRVVLGSSVPGPGNSATDLQIFAWPENSTTVSLAAIGCAPSGVAWLVPPWPVFADRGVDLALQPGVDPAVFVFGLAQQPILLPSAQGSACLLIPAPDAVLFMPAGNLHVPLPAAVRPVTFHIQGLAVTPSGLRTTDAYRVDAVP